MAASADALLGLLDAGREAVELAIAASSVVVHQLGTTGTATLDDLARLAIDPDDTAA